MPRKEPSTIELGVGGLKQYGGFVDEEWHPRLRGPKAAKIYEEMRDNDSTVGAVLYTIESFLRAVEWRVEPASDAPEALAEAEFLESVMHDMETPWEDFISDALSFLTYGYSLHEVVYKVRVGPNETSPRYKSKYSDSRYGWRDLALRPQSTIYKWDIDPVSGKVYGAIQRPVTGYVAGAEYYLPINRCVHLRTRPFKNNPEGRAILRNAYRSWYMKKRLEEIEAIGVSRDLSGMPVVEVPPQVMSQSATAAQRQTRADMERLVSQVHRDEREGIVFPSEMDADGKPTGYKFRLLSSSGGKTIPADPIIRRYDARIAMSMSAEFIMLGTEKQGSFALGAEKSANFQRSLAWYTQVIAQTLNKYAVARLYDANDVPVEYRAKICPSDVDKPSLAEFGLFLQQVGMAGLLHATPAVEAKIREIAKLPLEEDDLQGIFDDEAAAKEQMQALQAAAMSAKNQAVATGQKTETNQPDQVDSSDDDAAEPADET